MRLIFSVKRNKGQANAPDTGWDPIELDSEEDWEQICDTVAGAPFAHAMMTFDGGHRVASKALMRTGIMVDFDSDTTYSGDPVTQRRISDALAPLKCTYLLVPSKSHMKEKPASPTKPAQPAVERWHLYIPFSEPARVTPTLETAVFNLVADRFGDLGLDPTAFESARCFFPGVTREGMRWVVRTPIDPGSIIEGYAGRKDAEDYKERVAEAKRIARGGAPSNGKRRGRTSPKQQKGGEYWRKSQPVTLADGSTVMASEITEKTPCRCINPDHNDSHPSAFIAFNENGQQYVSCSSCNLTWWEKDWMSPYLDRLFYIDDALHSLYGSDNSAWEIGRYPQNGIIAPSQDAKAGLLAILAKKPMCRSKLIVQREKGGLVTPEPRKDHENSILHLPIPMQAASSQITPGVGNPLVEAWMAEMFGTYAEFIKTWASVFAFTNFVRLPVLVFNGDRGVGKSGFAEMLAALYPAGSRRWDGEVNGFNDELDSLFVYVEELPAAEHGHKDSKAFYRALKSLTGGKNIAINRKFGLKYEVRNNVNMVIATNDLNPIHLNPFERATDPANNQFFVLRIARKPNIDLPLWNRVQDSFPGWIRTEGHRRYLDWLNGEERTRARYGIYCPITEDEEAAYEDSKTEAETLAEDFWKALDTGRYNGKTIARDRMRPFFTAQDFANLAEAIGSGHSGKYLRELFQKNRWLERVEKLRFAGGQYKGCRPTSTGTEIWMASTPNL